MKILEVIFNLQSGGAERFVVDLSNELVQQGNEVALLAVRDIESDPESSFYKSYLDKNVKFYNGKIRYPGMKSYLYLRRLMKEFQPDAVHLHLNTLPYFFPFSLCKSKTKFFHTIHNIAEATIGYPGQKILNLLYYRSKRIIPVTISDFCNRSYQRVYNLPAADCVYNGRKEFTVTARLQDVQTEISKLKLHSDDRVFVLPATIYKSKNQELAVKVFARLHQENRHAVLLMLGKGTDQNYLNSIMADAAPNTFYLGVKDNVEDYLNCADAFMLSSNYEGNPISLLEALACGVVPVCTAVGGIPDVITEGKTGYLAEKVEAESLYAAVMRYLNDPEKIKMEALKQYYAENYTMKICAGKYLEFFHRYCKK